MMTPAINLVKKKRVIHKVHEYQHDASVESYGMEAAGKLGVPIGRIYKTLVVYLDNKQLAVGIVPVSAMLNMKSIAKSLGAKKAKMADPADVQRSTGYVLGGISPLGQKKKLKTVLHGPAKQHETIFVSAGRRGLEIELNPDDLLSLISGTYADICSG